MNETGGSCLSILYHSLFFSHSLPLNLTPWEGVERRRAPPPTHQHFAHPTADPPLRRSHSLPPSLSLVWVCLNHCRHNGRHRLHSPSPPPPLPSSLHSPLLSSSRLPPPQIVAVAAFAATTVFIAIAATLAAAAIRYNRKAEIRVEN